MKAKTKTIKIRKPTAKGTIRFTNRKRVKKSDKVGRKAKHKKNMGV